jgi:hypothetical protein
MSDQREAVRLAAELQAHLSGLTVPLTPDDRASVYVDLCEYVDGMKAMDWPPERVVVAVKRIAADAGVQPSTPMIVTAAAVSDTDQLLVDLVGWCIERYYADVLG